MRMAGKINVLVVDDTAVTRMMLVHVLEMDPEIHVMGVVSNVQAALDFVNTTKPDVVWRDSHMPVMDGFESTHHIMETNPVPIIICTATADPKEVASSFRLMEAGAVACIGKPVGPQHPDYQVLVATLLQTVKLMSEVTVVRRWSRA